MTTGERLVALSGLAGVSAMAHLLAITAGAPVAAPAGAGAYVITEAAQVSVTARVPADSMAISPAERHLSVPAKSLDGFVDTEQEQWWVHTTALAAFVRTGEQNVFVRTGQTSVVEMRPDAPDVYRVRSEYGS